MCRSCARYANLGVEVTQGRGALRAWADVAKGQLSGATADVVLADVEGHAGPQPGAAGAGVGVGPPGRQAARPAASNSRPRTCSSRPEKASAGPAATCSWRGTDGRGEVPAKGELRADKLDLEALGQVASRLPLGTVTHAAIQAYAPQGLVEALQARWQGRWTRCRSTRPRGRGRRLESGARPAARAAPASRACAAPPRLRPDQAGGKARLAIAQARWNSRRVRGTVLPLDTCGRRAVAGRGEQLSAGVDNLKFANADAQGEARPAGAPADAKTGAALSRRARPAGQPQPRRRHARVALPAAGRAEAARDYVREAVTVGDATAVNFRVRGRPARFPVR
jgi:uncharacterized protein YhdP